MFRKLLLVVCALVVWSGAAEARHHHYRHVRHVEQPTFGSWDSNPMFQQNAFQTSPTVETRSHRVASVSGQGVIGGRPSGCPRQFCGCGASLHLFGRIIPSLNLAANWFSFPPAAPAPDMVGVRSHHVFVLKQHIAGNDWLVYDANSGGHATRLHVRSIAGYSIRNPHGGSRYAAL